MGRRPLAVLQRAATDVVEAARRRRRRLDAQETGSRTAHELGRRLDETRARLRRDIPPRSD